MLPNPVTLVVMKLTAMRDRWQASQDSVKSAKVRELENGQARKHAEDVFRIAAMITREENESATEVLKAVRRSDAFSSTAAVLSQFFKSDENWGWQAVQDHWRPEDFQIIQNTLARWFT